MEVDFKVIVWIVIIGIALLSSVVRKVLERRKGPVAGPQPGEPPGEGVGDPAKGLRDFLRQLEGLSKDEEEPRTEAPPPRPTLPIPVPPRRPAPTTVRAPSAARPKVAEIALRPSTPSTARAGERLGAGVARGVTRVADAQARIAAHKMAARVRAAAGHTPQRLPVVPGMHARDIAESVVWAEILGKPRAMRPWRAPGVFARSA